MDLIEKFNLTEKMSIDELEQRLDVFRNYQQYVYILILIIVVSQLIFGMVLPTINTYQTESKTLKQYRQVLKFKQQQAADKENIKKELARLSTILDEKKQVFFTPGEVNEFTISGLPKIANRNNVRITSVTFQKPQNQKQNIKSHPVGLKLEAGFEDLMQFFHDLEQYKKVTQIDIVDIRRKSVEPVELNVGITIELFSVRN